MKVVMYGSHLCPDTIYAITKLEDQNIAIDFKNISASLAVLKEFMKIREQDAMFDSVKANGGLGIPYMLLEDGTKTFDYKDAIK